VLSFSGVPGCGGLLIEASGQFSSPSHPETYQNNLDCNWVIRADGSNNRIKLAFVSFNLEDQWACRHGLIINQICKGSYKLFFLCQVRLCRDPRGQPSPLSPGRTVLRQQHTSRVHLHRKHPVHQVQVGRLSYTGRVQDQLQNRSAIICIPISQTPDCTVGGYEYYRYQQD
jgi:hypothetical protein